MAADALVLGVGDAASRYLVLGDGGETLVLPAGGGAPAVPRPATIRSVTRRRELLWAYASLGHHYVVLVGL